MNTLATEIAEQINVVAVMAKIFAAIVAHAVVGVLVLMLVSNSTNLADAEE